MDKLRELMATYEAELREIADEHGGKVEVWRPEPAEVIQLQLPAPSHDPAPVEDSQVIEGEFGGFQFEEFEFDELDEFEPDGDETLH